MMINKYFSLLILSIWAQLAIAQVIDFETKLPASFKTTSKEELSLSKQYFKDGEQSLRWSFQPGSCLEVSLNEPFTLNSKAEERYGITLWIYNEQPQQDSIQFEFLSPQGKVSYHFSFRLAAAGWRACWIGFQHMKGDKKEKEIAGYRLLAPNRKGSIFLDRLTFPMKNINLRTTPDLQMPSNNSLSFRDLWHWCRVWQWEQYEYDTPLLTALTTPQQQELQTVEQRLTAMLDTKENPKTAIKQAYATFEKARIRRSGTGFTGAPVVAPDELERSKGELSWNDLETMLSGFAYDIYYNHSEASKANYFLVWEYAINQGFAFGSGMGTNHHYGYQIRKIYTTAWLIRNTIRQSPHGDSILSALTFWSALQETRKPCQHGRDELLDSWHTLLMPKIVSALLFKDECERMRALKGLSRWISTSLQYTPGTIGGIKVDGTTFHHGGFYPAYTTGVLATIGGFVHITTGTQYELSEDARQVLKSAFTAMRNYSNKYEWGVGISGRHPFGGSMKADDIAAFAYLALSGDLSGEGHTFDRPLAADYLRLCKEDTPEARYFKEQSIVPALAPQGFFVYNYGAVGIFRRNDWMVTLKGYTTDVWGSEIYKKDNRFGRYQSYGSVQIMNQPSRLKSGYNENGWDWNRLPGTTTIHLPFELLDSPLPETTMAHSTENFAGSSSLLGENGMFAIKLMERNLKNFTPDFVARKSVFCFQNRMICLGTGISNSNTEYSTETTLFQSSFEPGKGSILVNGEKESTEDFNRTLIGKEKEVVTLKDGYDNYYYITNGNVNVRIAQQHSLHEKTRIPTQGIFASAWISHGNAPKAASYEYMVWIQPSPKELETVHPEQSYRIVQRNDRVHMVYDKPTGITAYAAFEAYQSQSDEVFTYIPAETMVMYLKRNNEMVLSICDPNLNIEEKAYTTKQPSRVIKKRLELKGAWQLSSQKDNVTIISENGDTVIYVLCQHGQPVEIKLVNHSLL